MTHHTQLWTSALFLTLCGLCSCAHNIPSEQLLIKTTTCDDGECQIANKRVTWTPDMDFVTVWRVPKSGALTIPTGQGSFDYSVDWENDGVFDQTHLTASTRHRYSEPGLYTVRIRGAFPHLLIPEPPPPRWTPGESIEA